MTACNFLIGLALNVGASAIAWLWVQVTRSATCPKGHRDLYHLLRWRYRECERVAQVRRLRRLARGRDMSRW
jgi:hypothetical protein